MYKLKLITGLILMCFLFSEASAQVSKGNLLVGAKSDFGAFFGSSKNEFTSDGTTTENDGPSTTNFNLTPKVGYFFIDGLAAGLFITVDVDNSKEDQQLETGGTETLKDNNTLFRVGPFVRYYYDMDQIKPFGELYIGFGSNNNKYDYLDYDYSNPLNPTVTVKEDERKYNLFGWGIGAGAAFFITNSVSIDAMIKYDRNRSKYEDDNNNEMKNKSGTFGLDVGFTIIIPAS